MTDSHHNAHRPPAADSAGDLAHLLEPALIAACGERLSNIQWFRSAWQAGGASTGFAKFTQPDTHVVEVVVKLPVGPNEHRWTSALGSIRGVEGGRGGGAPNNGHPDEAEGPLCHCTPRVLASGIELGGYDLAWLVVEKLHGTPLNTCLDEHAVRDLLTAAADYYSAAAKARPVADADPPPSKDWESIIARGRDAIHKHGINEEQRWNQAIKAVQRILPRLIERWLARPINTWCHGDLHFGNALRRQGVSPGSGCVLIDLALIHPGHWVEDAVYLERLYWAKPELLCGIKPVSFLAKLLRERGLSDHEDYAMLANIRRVLMAACVPAFLLHEGHPRYVHAALEILERTLPMVGK